MSYKQQLTKSKTGFTIIEVVLVLAIAGLIFLMVFVALPALQRSQRDTQRRQDMSRFISQLIQYQTNNNGSAPTNTVAGYSSFISSYLKPSADDTFKDPGGSDYSVNTVTNCTSSACANASVAADTASGYIRVYTNATCSGENPKYVSGPAKIAITYKLEGSGTYCANN